MTDGPSLLAAILASPDEDTPRLMYADWLQEHGEDERAEFIRVQCDKATWRVCPYGPSCHSPAAFCPECARRNAVCAREHDLWNTVRPTGWVIRDPFPLEMAVHCIPPESHAKALTRSIPVAVYERGLIGRVTCTAADWLAHADAVLAAHPVRRVTLTRVSGGDLYALSLRLGLPPETPIRQPYEETIREWFATGWPDITFELRTAYVGPPVQVA